MLAIIAKASAEIAFTKAKMSGSNKTVYGQQNIRKNFRGFKYGMFSYNVQPERNIDRLTRTRTLPRPPALLLRRGIGGSRRLTSKRYKHFKSYSILKILVSA